MSVRDVMANFKKLEEMNFFAGVFQQATMYFKTNHIFHDHEVTKYTGLIT